MNVKYVITGIKVAVSIGLSIMMVKVAEPAIDKFCKIDNTNKNKTISENDIPEECCK